MTSLDDVFSRHTTISAMLAARSAIIKEHPFLIHSAKIGDFGSIKKIGLVPHNPGFAAHQPNDLNFTKMICLHPHGTFDALPKLGDRFLICMPSVKLPERIGPDWSYDTYLARMDLFKSDHPHLDDVDAFLFAARKFGSVAVFDSIPAANLYVWTSTADRDAPGTWLPLLTTQECDVHFLRYPS